MINFNGQIIAAENIFGVNNRAFLYGDGVFETLKVINGKVLFMEDHYFRLMSSMRILRMEIPMNFTLEYIEEQILELVKATDCNESARVRLTVYRNDGGFYLPKDNNVSFVIKAEALENKQYVKGKSNYEVELYKDFYVTSQLLSSVKSTNRLINVTGSIFASENDYDTCLLLNDNKNIIEALQGNIFMLVGNQLVTPPVSEGCVNGIMRKQILKLLQKSDAVEVIEQSISPFDLQKADELFITNVILGIQSITKYRKKEFTTKFADELLVKLNEELLVKI
ncbi:MAG: aminotransferase class IV [Flavobacterium sp.]